MSLATRAVVLPSAASWASRERRTATIANSVATKNPLAPTSTSTAARPNIRIHSTRAGGVTGSAHRHPPGTPGAHGRILPQASAVGAAVVCACWVDQVGPALRLAQPSDPLLVWSLLPLAAAAAALARRPARARAAVNSTSSHRPPRATPPTTAESQLAPRYTWLKPTTTTTRLAVVQATTTRVQESVGVTTSAANAPNTAV